MNIFSDTSINYGKLNALIEKSLENTQKPKAEFLGWDYDTWSIFLIPLISIFSLWVINHVVKSRSIKKDILKKQNHFHTWIPLIKKQVSKQADEIKGHGAKIQNRVNLREVKIYNLHIDKIKIYDAQEMVHTFIVNKTGKEEEKAIALFDFVNGYEFIERHYTHLFNQVKQYDTYFQEFKQAWNDNSIALTKLMNGLDKNTAEGGRLEIKYRELCLKSGHDEFLFNAGLSRIIAEERKSHNSEIAKIESIVLNLNHAINQLDYYQKNYSNLFKKHGDELLVGMNKVEESLKKLTSYKNKFFLLLK